MASHTVRVTYRGAVHSVAVSPDASVGDLGASLEDATKASIATQKILGVRSRPGGVLLPGRDADARLLVADVPGLADAPKPFMLVGTPAAAIAALDAAAAVDHRVAGFDEEALRARRRRKGHASRPSAGASSASGAPPGAARRRDPGPPSSATHPYTFGEYRPLPVPPSVHPPASSALALLHKLARDPGILGVMAKHRWKVPLLAEMPPEGKVGVSESCVLGYNVNRGQEIHLRLRTDDLRGFRRYARVRETLLHELTHNVHGPHDVHFKRLCSQLNVECREFDWASRSRDAANRLGGAEAARSSDEETWSEDEVMAATRESSGKPLGGDAVDAEKKTPAEKAAEAARRRAADAAEREMAALADEAIENAKRARDAGGEGEAVTCGSAEACACGACGACGAGGAGVAGVERIDE
jgi:hypothetical protein